MIGLEADARRATRGDRGPGEMSDDMYDEELT
jgi:hypothetical protein